MTRTSQSGASRQNCWKERIEIGHSQSVPLSVSYLISLNVYAVPALCICFGCLMQLRFTLYNEGSLRPGSVARALYILAQPMLITTVRIGAIASPISKTRMLRYREVTPLAKVTQLI